MRRSFRQRPNALVEQRPPCSHVFAAHSFELIVFAPDQVLHHGGLEGDLSAPTIVEAMKWPDDEPSHRVDPHSDRDVVDAVTTLAVVVVQSYQQVTPRGMSRPL